MSVPAFRSTSAHPKPSETIPNAALRPEECAKGACKIRTTSQTSVCTIVRVHQRAGFCISFCTSPSPRPSPPPLLPFCPFEIKQSCRSLSNPSQAKPGHSSLWRGSFEELYFYQRPPAVLFVYRDNVLRDWNGIVPDARFFP